MNFEEIIKSQEIYEPETLEMLFPGMTSLDRQKIQVLWLLQNTRSAYEDLEVFEKVVLILNGIEPDVTKMEGSTPEFIWKALDMIAKIHKDIELADEVKQYIKYIFDDHGYSFYPPTTGLEQTSLYDKVVRQAETGPFPLKEDALGIQVIRYMRIMKYINK